MKKVISFVAALTLLVSMLAFNASAASELEFSVTKAKGKPGKTVTVDVMLDKNVGTWAMKFYVKYNSKYFDLVSVTPGEVYAASEITKGNIDDSGTYVFYAESNGMTDVLKTGKVLTLEFKILKAAPNGEHDITLEFPDDGDGWFFGIGPAPDYEYIDRTVELREKGAIKVVGSFDTEYEETTKAPETDEAPELETEKDSDKVNDKETDKTPDSETEKDSDKVTDKETGKETEKDSHKVDVDGSANEPEVTDAPDTYETELVTEIVTELVTDAEGEVVTDTVGEPVVTEVVVVVPVTKPATTDTVVSPETEKTPVDNTTAGSDDETEKSPETEIVYVTDAEGEKVTEPDGKPVTEIVVIEDEGDAFPVQTVIIIVCIVAAVVAAALIAVVVVSRRKNDEAEAVEASESKEEENAEEDNQ